METVLSSVGDMFNGADLIITGFSTVCDPTALLAVGFQFIEKVLYLLYFCYIIQLRLR